MDNNKSTSGAAVTITQNHSSPRNLVVNVEPRKLHPSQIPEGQQAWTVVRVEYFHSLNSGPGRDQSFTRRASEFELKLRGDDFGAVPRTDILKVRVNLAIGLSADRPTREINLGEVTIPGSKLRLIRKPEAPVVVDMIRNRMKDLMQRKVIPPALLAYAGVQLAAINDA